MKRIILLFLLLSTYCFSTETEFREIYSNTLKFEGKTYVKTKIEESKYGISSNYSKDVKNLTEEDAFKIAYKKIYKAHKINQIENENIRKFIFDWLYNSAPKNAIKRIQKLLDIEVTGVMNEETIKIINDFQDTDLLLYLLKRDRLTYLQSLKHYKKYEKGWKNRIENIC